MKNHRLKILMGAMTGLLLFSALTNIHEVKKQYKPGDYIEEDNAYFVRDIREDEVYTKRQKFLTPTDDKYNKQKTRSLGSNLIGDIESVWSSYTGKGTTIAIIDDGFDVDHPEFRRSDNSSAILETSAYFHLNYAQTKVVTEYYAEDPDCIKEDWESKEWATHGTATSTTAAAPMGNNGGVGIAPDANILALKMDFYDPSIEAAIKYAVDQGADVINMSLGGYAENFTDGFGDAQQGSSSAASYLNSICQYAYQHGVIVVAAAGNEATYHKSYPACNYKVIGVGALGDWYNKGNANKLAEFTNYNGSSQSDEVNVDILAPGYVYTAERQGTQSSPTHTWDDTQGTSFSCPIIAGAACLWKEKYPNGTPDQFLTQLQSTADGIGSYASQYIPVSEWDEEFTDQGPSNIQCGRLNVAKLMDIDDPYVDAQDSDINIVIGQEKQLIVTSHSGTLTYSSSNTNVATVSNTGLVTGKAAGDAVITVTATKNAKTATDTELIHVQNIVEATSLTFDPKETTIAVGETYESEPTITLTPSNASRYILFESNNESVATVDIDTGVVTGVSAGDATIYATVGYGAGGDNLTVHVTGPTSVSDTLTRATTGISGTNYSSWSGKTGESGAVYAGQSAGGNDSIQLRSNNNNSGIIATKSGGKISKITVDWNSNTADGRTIDIYGKNSAYSAPTDLYGNNQGTKLGSISTSSTELVVSGDYEYVGVRSNSGALYLNSITFTWNGAGSGGDTTPKVNSVTVSPSQLALDKYNNPTGNLTATVSVSNGAAQTVTWETSNSAVATVSDGTVTAKGAGSATITARSTVDNTKYGTCAVTVTDSTPAAKTLTSISISGYKTAFTVGDTFTFGGTVTANFSDNTNANVTSSATFTGYDMSTAGQQTVTVSYTYSGTTKTQQYQITVAASGGSASGTHTLTITRSSFSSSGGYAWYDWSQDGTDGTTIAGKAELYTTTTTSMQFNKGKGNENAALFNTTPLPGSITKIEAKTSSGTNRSWSGYVTSTACSVNNNSLVFGSDKTTVGTATINTSSTTLGTSTAGYSYFCFQENVNSASYLAEIKITYEVVDTSDKIVKSLSASYTGGDVYVGNSLDTSKVSVTASYTDSSKYPDATLPAADYELSGFNSTSAGNKTVTVTYIGKLATLSSPLTTSFTVPVISDSVKSVTVTNTKTYHPGDTIAKGDITVTLSWNSGKADTTTTDFTFANDGYMFTYADAPSGGSAASKQFSITYNNQAYNFNVSVSRNNYSEPTSSSLTLTGSQGKSAGITGTGTSGAKDYSSLTINGVTCAATNIYVFTTSNVSYFSFGTGAGEIHNTIALSKPLSSLTASLKSGSRSDVKYYVSTTGNENDWVLKANANFETTNYYFFKVAFEGTGSTYSNFNNINLELKGTDTVNNVANYIMINDTNGQCTTKLGIAINKLNAMSAADKSTFWTSNDYVIKTARERLLAWAVHEGKEISFANNTFTVTNGTANILTPLADGNTPLLITIVSLTCVLAFGGYLLIKRRKEN